MILRRQVTMTASCHLTLWRPQSMLLRKLRPQRAAVVVVALARLALHLCGQVRLALVAAAVLS